MASAMLATAIMLWDYAGTKWADSKFALIIYRIWAALIGVASIMDAFK